MNPPSSGSIPLQEYRRDIPPGWIPGDASYPLRTYFDKLKLWYRIANVEDEAIGPLVAGRLYGRASTIAMSLRVPRPDGTFDVGDAALVRLAVDEVRDPATNAIIQNHIPSGVQFLANALRTAFGQQDQDLATQALDKFFGLARGKLSLSEYSVEFDSRYDDAHDRAGLQLNDVGKFFLWFKNYGLPSKTVDDIKLQVAGDYTRFNDARALALRINPNRREPDDAQILYEENDESYGDYDAYYQDWGDDYEAEDSWWYGYEEANEGEWVYEEYANDETYYENHDASDESCPMSRASTTKPTTKEKAMAVMTAASTVAASSTEFEIVHLARARTRRAATTTKEKESQKASGDGDPTSKERAKSRASILGEAKAKEKEKALVEKATTTPTRRRTTTSLVVVCRSVKAFLMPQLRKKLPQAPRRSRRPRGPRAS